MSSEKAREIALLVRRVDRADQELGSELRAITERLLLQKLTRRRDKKSQLDSIPWMAQKITGKSGQQPQGKSMDYGTNLARGYSAAVDMLEGMDSQGLADMIALLRKTSAPEPVREEVRIPPEDPLQHLISCLKKARLGPMHKALYDKLGDGAKQRLYDAGEVYGKRLALEIKNKGLGLEKTIREVEQVAKLAGWGTLSFHRIDARNIEAIIENTMFSYKKEEAKNSCHFAAGIVGGVISVLLAKVGSFLASETECVSDGCTRCRFGIAAK